jgi:hypothetical protein
VNRRQPEPRSPEGGRSQEEIDHMHDNCIEGGWLGASAHTHEGQRGWWLFPDEVLRERRPPLGKPGIAPEPAETRASERWWQQEVKQAGEVMTPVFAEHVLDLMEEHEIAPGDREFMLHLCMDTWTEAQREHGLGDHYLIWQAENGVRTWDGPYRDRHLASGTRKTLTNRDRAILVRRVSP